MNDKELYKVTLTTKSPVFVGSGGSFTKKEYLYNERTKRVTVIDGAKLMRWLVTKGGPVAIDEYERFMLGGAREYLSAFLDRIKISQNDRLGLCLYEADASEAIHDNGTLMEIRAFMRDALNRPYVPGSSLKGALRTAILVKLLRGDKNPQPLPDDMSGKDFEPHYLNTLNKKDNEQDALNSVMRGISVSDSAPLAQSCIALTRKIDRFRNGNSNTLNIARECVRPGTNIEFTLLITPALCKGINAEFITNAVCEFGDYYKAAYSDKFKPPQDDVGENFEDCILLGGGSGYFSKNIAYPGRDWNVALKRVSEVMQKNFRNHKHWQDESNGISPRAIKYTEYRNPENKALRSYQLGVCHFSMIRAKDD